MIKSQYFFGVILSIAIIIAGVILTLVFLNAYAWSIALGCSLSYALAAVLANVIWYDGPIHYARTFSPKLCSNTLNFIVNLTKSVVGWMIIFSFWYVLLLVLFMYAIFTIFYVLLRSLIMFPINAIRFAFDLI